MNRFLQVKLGDVAKEVVERAGGHSAARGVFGVEKNRGLTAQPRYQSKDLSRYKVIEPGMFAYNPMRLNIGSIGYCTKQQGRGLVSPDYIVFECDANRLLPEFFFYETQSLQWRHWLALAGEGSVRERIYFRKLAEYEVSLPPISYQRAVLEILQTLDERIDLNRRTNETLEAISRAIFKDWFVDFGPTKAKVEGQPAYLAADIWALFPSDLDDRKTPRGWATGTIGDYADLNPESWSRKTYPASIRYVDLSGTKWGTIEAIEYHTADTAPSRAQRILKPGDTIVGLVRPGNGSFAFIGASGLTGSTGFAVLRSKRTGCQEFIYLAATSPENIKRLAHLADGGAYPAVRPEVVMATKVPLAPEPVIRAFNSYCEPILSHMEANRQEVQTLSELRDLLLAKLMSGEIGIREAGRVAVAA